MLEMYDFFFFFLAKRIFSHFNVFHFFFLDGVKQKSKKFIVKNVFIHNVPHNEPFFFNFLTFVEMSISSFQCFLFFSCKG
jgi:hypothetical protein